MKFKLFPLLVTALVLAGCQAPNSSQQSLSSTSSSEISSNVSSEESSSSSSSSEESSSEIIGQIGVGSGLSADDPIFKGNPGSDELNITFLEMSWLYGDSIFLKLGDVEVLIDAGQEQDGENVYNFLNEHVSDNKLDMLITTHAHSDHIGGMPRALEAIETASLIVDFGYRREKGEGYLEYRAKRDALVGGGAKYCGAYDSVNGAEGCASTYYLTTDFYVEILDTKYYRPTDEVWTSDPNLTSVTTVFHYKDFSFFTAGDLPTKGEEKLLNTNALKPVTLYKSSHHGTNGGNTRRFLDALNPKAVGISAARAGQYNDPTGTNNPSYNLDGAAGHPHREAVERIYQTENIKTNLNVYWNMTAGDMTFHTNGLDEAPIMNGTPTKRGYYLKVNGVYEVDEETGEYLNKVTGEENFRLHETEVFKIRNYTSFLTA